MPELDGPGATRQIRALPAPKCHVPIIAMTANAQPGAREEYLAAGMDDYVTKPISPATLLGLLERFESSLQAPMQTGDSDLLLDRETVKILGNAMGENGLNAFLTLFREDTQGNLDAMAFAIASGDLPAAARSAHALVSSAGNVGAQRVSKLARTLETAAKAEDKDGATRQLDQLRHAFQGTVQAIAKLHEPDRAVA
jgi:CheY-like chemotaxis protein